MRLEVVASGHRFTKKLMHQVMRVVSGRPVPDVVKMLTYRPELLGNPLNLLTQAVMRGPSAWSVTERELFAAFVSAKNRCPF